MCRLFLLKTRHFLVSIYLSPYLGSDGNNLSMNFDGWFRPYDYLIWVLWSNGPHSVIYT